MWVTISVKQAAVPRHCGPITGGGLPPGGLPPGELPDGLLIGLNEFKKTAATTTIPRRAMITTADPRGIRLIAGTNESRRIQRFRLLDTEGRRVPSAAYRVRMTPGARKWARPDLDWRPSGYQPDAPTRLSYGPARRRKTTNRLKDSFEERPPTPGHPLIAYRARDVDRISADCHAAIGTRFGFSTGRPERMRDPRFEPLEPELERALGRKLRSVSGDAE